MANCNFEQKLKDCSGRFNGELYFDYPIISHSTISVGGNVFAFSSPSSVEELKELIKLTGEYDKKVLIIGNGSNILMPDNMLDAVVISMRNIYTDNIVFDGDEVSVAGGVLLSRVISTCLKQGFSSLEGLIGIPATIGGALAMNASHLSGISSSLKKVLILDNDLKEKWIDKNDIDFGYRHSSLKNRGIILKAVFLLDKSLVGDPETFIRSCMLEKTNKQPLDKKTLGCIFKNPVNSTYSSGKLIEMSGLKGAMIGDAKISEKHANFIVNTGNAAAADITGLIDYVKKTVEKDHGIELEMEIEVIS